MSKTILQINHKISSSRSEYTELVNPLAEPIAAVDGLLWKIWLINEADHEAGGIYLFENQASAQAFMNSQTVADFVAHPMISDVSAKLFEPDEQLSHVTRGPLGLGAEA